MKSESAGGEEWRITQVDYKGARQRYEEYVRRQAELPNRLRRHSALWRMGQRLWSDLTKDLSKMETIGPTPAFQANQKDLGFLGVHYCDEPPEYVQAWNLTRRILARLNQEVRAAGARLLVVSVPAMHEVNEDAMARVASQAFQPDRLCLEEAAAYKRLTELLAELDIDYLDLLPVFRQARRQTGVELFRRSDKHWNPQGHALAARELAAALERSGYLNGHGAKSSPR